MRWIAFTLTLLAGVLGPERTALAQTVSSSIRVQATPLGAPFWVDGVRYTSPQVFFWTEGSRHTLAGEPTPLTPPPTSYAFQAWTDSSGNLSTAAMTISVIATPAVTQYQASYIASHRLTLMPGEPGSGTVDLGTESIAGPITRYFTHGTEISLRAQPAPGWVFTSWTHRGVPANAYLTKFAVTEPIDLRPIFARGRTATIRSTPTDLTVLVDGNPMPSPATVDWALYGTYRVSVQSPQRDAAGNWWVFDSWDLGQAGVSTEQSASYYVTNGGDFTLTARFRPGATAIFETQPYGLRLNIDGRENWMNYIFVWPVGAAKAVVAPAEQLDGQGRRWRFKEWAHGGDAAQTFTVTDAMANRETRWLARYEAMPRVRIETTPSGVPLAVDGTPCLSPCTRDVAAGAEIRVAAAETVNLSADSRLAFAGWADGGAAERRFTVTKDATLTAAYRREHRVATSSTPTQAASFRLDPSSGSFVTEGTTVTIEATALPGYRFLRWEGDANGSGPTTRVTVTAPRQVSARLEAVPYVDPAGVRNAAREFETAESDPEPVVAPGSRVVILGKNLATQDEAARTNPLPQTLSGVIVYWRERMLPLVSASPERIELVLPWDIETGVQKLSVRRAGQPDIEAEARVVRNAPGLYAEGLRLSDGSTVLNATGLGPVAAPPFDGFATPPGFDRPSIDAVEVLAGDEVLAVTARLKVGATGLFSVRATLPAGVTTVQLRVGRRTSNAILLPLD